MAQIEPLAGNTKCARIGQLVAQPWPAAALRGALGGERRGGRGHCQLAAGSAAAPPPSEHLHPLLLPAQV